MFQHSVSFAHRVIFRGVEMAQPIKCLPGRQGYLSSVLTSLVQELELACTCDPSTGEAQTRGSLGRTACQSS